MAKFPADELPRLVEQFHSDVGGASEQSYTPMFRQRYTEDAFTRNEVMEREVILQTLRHDVASAKEKLVVATETFDAIIHEALSVLPYPDRVQRIHTVAKALTIARQEYIRAFARLDAYVGEEIIPDNLKNG